MEEIGKALKTIFDKIADFFDLFDLSFFVSGIVVFIMVYLLMPKYTRLIKKWLYNKK